MYRLMSSERWTLDRTGMRRPSNRTGNVSHTAFGSESMALGAMRGAGILFPNRVWWVQTETPELTFAVQAV